MAVLGLRIFGSRQRREVLPARRRVDQKIENYGYPGRCPTTPEKIDWSICGSDWETIQVSGSPAATHINAQVTAQNASLAIQLVCPNTGTANWTYDATSTGVVFYLHFPTGDGGTYTRADTYTRM